MSLLLSMGKFFLIFLASLLLVFLIRIVRQQIVFGFFSKLLKKDDIEADKYSKLEIVLMILGSLGVAIYFTFFV